MIQPTDIRDASDWLPEVDIKVPNKFEAMTTEEMMEYAQSSRCTREDHALLMIEASRRMEA